MNMVLLNASSKLKKTQAGSSQLKPAQAHIFFVTSYETVADLSIRIKISMSLSNFSIVLKLCWYHVKIVLKKQVKLLKDIVKRNQN